MRQMRGLLAALCVASLLGGVVGGGQELPPQRKAHIRDFVEPTVIGTYYVWYNVPPPPGWMNWAWWGPGPVHNPEHTLPNGQRDIASVYYPLIGPYDSSDEGLLTYHVQLAQAMGLDVLKVSWLGRPRWGENSRFQDESFRRLLDVAAGLGFRVAIEYEVKLHFLWVEHPTPEALLEAIRGDLLYVLQEYSQHPAYWRVAGLPVIFVWDITRLSPHEWADVVESLEAEGYVFLLGGEAARPEYFPVFSVLYRWILLDFPTWERETRSLAEVTRGRRDVFPAAGVWPGFNDRGVWGWGAGPRFFPSNDGETYAHTWKIARETGAPWVIVMTFNDWPEGTIIEPSVEHGYQYGILTQRYARAFKNLPPGDEGLLERLTQEYLEQRGGPWP